MSAANRGEWDKKTTEKHQQIHKPAIRKKTLMAGYGLRLTAFT
jgi:hypothetical protein